MKEYQDPNWNNSRSCLWQRTSSRCTWGLAFSINLTCIPSRCLVHQWQVAMMAVKMIFCLRRVIIELLTVLTHQPQILGSSNAILWKYVLVWTATTIYESNWAYLGPTVRNVLLVTTQHFGQCNGEKDISFVFQYAWIRLLAYLEEIYVRVMCD